MNQPQPGQGGANPAIGQGAAAAPLVPGPQQGAQAIIGGQGIVAVQPAQAQGALPAQELHQTFSGLFQDPTKDPFHETWAQVLQRFDNAATAEEVLTTAATSLPGTATCAYLCCTALHPNVPPRIYSLHTLSRFPPATLDGAVTPWNNSIFACLGDVLQGAVATVSLPQNAFALTQHGRVHLEAVLPDHLAQLQGPNLLNRLADGAVDTDQLRTRSLIYLPARFTPLFLSNRGVSPKDAYLTFTQAIQQEQAALGEVQPVLDWLKLSLYKTLDDNSGPPVTSLQITTPLMDEDLVKHRAPFTAHVLTPRVPQAIAGGSLEAAINHMATAVTQQTAEVHRAQLARAAERDAPNTPSTKFGLLLESLKNYLNVTEENELPEFWFQFAAAPKKQEFSVIRDYLELYARSEEAFISTTPVLSPKLHADLASITFVADHNNDLKTGLQPFIAMDGSEEHRAASLELARSYSLLYERDHGVSLADLAQLKLPKDLRSFPSSFFDLERNLGLFGNLLGALLGNAHPLTQAYRPFWTSFTKRYRDRLLSEIDGHRVIKPVHILRSVQLLCWDWFDAKRSRVPPDEPNFSDIWKRIGLNSYTLPQLPPTLYSIVYPRTNLLRPPPTHPSPTGASTQSSHGTTPTMACTDESTVQSGVSNITGTTGLTGQTGLSLRTPRTSSMVINENPDRHLLSLIPFNRKLRELMGLTTPPDTDSGQQICLSFHARGACYSNCRRKQTHGITLNHNEKQRLENYIADRLEKSGN